MRSPNNCGHQTRDTLHVPPDSLRRKSDDKFVGPLADRTTDWVRMGIRVVVYKSSHGGSGRPCRKRAHRRRSRSKLSWAHKHGNEDGERIAEMTMPVACISWSHVSARPFLTQGVRPNASTGLFRRQLRHGSSIPLSRFLPSMVWCSTTWYDITRYEVCALED